MKLKLVTIALCLTSTLFAEFKIGDQLPPVTLTDQFENRLQVKTTDRLLIMAFEKDIATAINNYLKTKPDSFLERNHARYISDISAMPSFVTSMFAIPKMKKYPFSIMLINDDFGKQFSKKEGKVTLYKIKNLKVNAIEFMTTDKLPTLFHKQ